MAPAAYGGAPVVGGSLVKPTRSSEADAPREVPMGSGASVTAGCISLDAGDAARSASVACAALAVRPDEAVGSFVTMERVAEAHMKVRDAKPISAEAARFAKKDLIKFGAGVPGFWSMVQRHIGSEDAVVD